MRNITIVAKLNISNPAPRRYLYTRAILLFMLCQFSLSAQKKAVLPTEIRPLNETLAEMRLQNLAESQHLETLITNIQPSVYVTDQSLKSYGSKPVCLFTDVSSVASLAVAAEYSATIEIITIKISAAADLTSKIDLTQFSDYHKLRYVYILCEFDASPAQIAAMLLNSNPNFSIIYAISKPS